MKAKKSFFDPFTQRAYTTDEEYTPIKPGHADWLLERDLILQDETSLKVQGTMPTRKKSKGVNSANKASVNNELGQGEVVKEDE